MIENQPVSMIEWVSVNELTANHYNPNVCTGREFKLLKHSVLRQGWIQPILVDNDGVIIDGFHRYTLAKTDEEVFGMTGGKVPVVRLDLPPAERKMLTVRINRAKGVHVAFKMHELVSSLINEEGCTVPELCAGIGATKEEVDVLMMENVFQAKEVATTAYSKAWRPKPKEA